MVLLSVKLDAEEEVKKQVIHLQKHAQSFKLPYIIVGIKMSGEWNNLF